MIAAGLGDAGQRAAGCIGGFGAGDVTKCVSSTTLRRGRSYFWPVLAVYQRQQGDQTVRHDDLTRGIDRELTIVARNKSVTGWQLWGCRDRSGAGCRRQRVIGPILTALLRSPAEGAAVPTHTAGFVGGLMDPAAQAIMVGSSGLFGLVPPNVLHCGNG
jgi:hypothetical protein